jgi:replication factor C subunit 3/5
MSQLKIDLREFTTPSNKKLEISIVSSNYHLELTPRYDSSFMTISDVGIYDRVVIQDLIKEIAQTQQVDASAKRSFKGILFQYKVNIKLWF